LRRSRRTTSSSTCFAPTKLSRSCRSLSINSSLLSRLRRVCGRLVFSRVLQAI
jgi:hypothetical protein